MASKKKVRNHPEAILKIIDSALAKPKVVGGNYTIITQFCELKEKVRITLEFTYSINKIPVIFGENNYLLFKVDPTSVKEWKSRIQPTEEDTQKLISSRGERRTLEANAAAASAMTVKESLAKARRSKVASFKSVSEPIVNITERDPDERVVNLDINNPPLKCLTFLLKNFGSEVFEQVIKNRSKMQLRNADKMFTAMEIASSGVSVSLSKLQPRATVTSTRFLSADDLKTMTGTLLIMDPSTNTYGTLATLTCSYQHAQTGEEIFSTTRLSSEGESFGMELAIPGSDSVFNIDADRVLPGWNNTQPLWLPSCRIKCVFKTDVDESLLQIRSLSGIELRFLLIPCASFQEAQRLVRGMISDHIKSTLKARAGTLTACHGIPALNIAAFSGNRSVVKNLIANGADPNMPDNYNSSTALHEAVLGKQMQTIELLISKGAIQTVRNSLGQTPLHIACLLGDIASIKALCRSPFAKKASQIVDKNGKRPNEVCKGSYSRSVLEEIMKNSGIVFRPQRTGLL